MSVLSAARSLNQRPPGDWPRRLLRYHLPLAIASTVVLVLFMTLPAFDAGKSPPAMPDIVVEGISAGFPPRSSIYEQMMSRASSSDNQGGPPQGAAHTGPPQGAGGAGHAGPPQGAGGTPSMGPSSGNALSMRQFTFATGYVALGFLGLTLLTGPANLMLRRRNPVSSYFRRDVGLWAVMASGAHVAFGLLVGHGGGEGISAYLNYFVRDGSPLTNSFGLANWTGLAATVIAVGLLAISSNFALRKLKARTWKNLQRLNYVLVALVIAHAFFYGALLRAESPYTLLLLLSVIAVIVGQAVGVWLWRRRHARTTAKLSGATQ